MVDPDLCSSRVLSHFREESGDEELSVLPRHTKVVVTGNNRTKSVLVGLQGVVKKAVGLGGWHWLVLKNGVEVKLQRNALSVLEHPTGNEDDLDHNSSSNSDINERDIDFSSSARFLQKLNKPRARHRKPSIHSNSSKTSSRGYCRGVHSIHAPHLRVNLAKLGSDALWRYCRRYNLVGSTTGPSREHMIDVVRRHFALELKVNEVLVIKELLRGAKTPKSFDMNAEF